MADAASTLQLPKMPTNSGMPAPPSGAALQAFLGGVATPQPAAPAGPGALPTLQSNAGGFNAPLGMVAPAPAPTVTPSAPAAPVTPRAPNPYAPGGVIPPVAGPEAIAAFQSTVAQPEAILARAAAANVRDPQANQIRFVDQNTPHYAAGPQATPGVIAGGMPREAGSGMTNADLKMLTPLIQPRMTPAERVQHEILDIHKAQLHTNIAGAKTVQDLDAAKGNYLQQLWQLLTGPTGALIANQTPPQQ